MDNIDYIEVRIKVYSLKGPASYIGAERVRRAAEIIQFNVDNKEGPKIYKKLSNARRRVHNAQKANTNLPMYQES